jgi:uncharacterized protein (DUF58 family)
MLPFDPRELVRSGGLTQAARTVVEGLLAGRHLGLRRDFTSEINGHRINNPGDDPRRAAGRTDRPLGRETASRTKLNATIVLDASGSMGFRGERRPSKFEYARHVAAALAYLVIARRDAVGLVVHDSAVRQVLPPRAAAQHLLGLHRTLEPLRPGGESAVAAIWHRIAARHLKRRGRVVLLSDGFDEPAHLLHALRGMRKRGHEVLFFHVLAPDEIEFPFDRPAVFRNLERPGEGIRSDARARAEYLRNFAAYCEALKRGTRELKVEYEVLRTDVPVADVLLAYLARR